MATRKQKARKTREPKRIPYDGLKLKPGDCIMVRNSGIKEMPDGFYRVGDISGCQVIQKK